MDPLASPGIAPGAINRWSKWLDAGDRATRYIVVADVPAGAHHVPVRVIGSRSHPAAGLVVQLARDEFGTRFRQVHT
jgi:hypothetical protein